jgi:hypothetical protein
MPTGLSSIDISLEGIGHVLRDRQLGVPPYQRSYAWQSEQVETFWWDLRSAFDSQQPEYFLGTIVLTSGTGKDATVIDGQQRLATTAMLFAALRDEFLRQGDTYRAAVIEGQYIAGRELRSAELTPRVRLNAEDDSFFRTWVLAHPEQRAAVSTSSLSGSNRRLMAALELLSRHVTEHVAAAGPAWEDTLIRWIDLLESQARVINVVVGNEADAFLIFETLNDRGLTLTVADLLKNYLFGLARDDVDEVQRAWLSALDVLESAADEETFTTFLRHYWSSIHGATRERDLYRQLRSTIRTREAAIAFTQALETAAPLYAGLLDSAHPVWERWPGLTPEADTLLRLGLEQNRPLALAAMHRFDADGLRDLLRAMISWSVRGLIVGGIGGGQTERYFSEAARKVNAGTIDNTNGVLRELAPVLRSDNEFMRAFEIARVNKSRLAHYYLVALERALTGAQDPALVPSAEEEEWVLQLALPRMADAADWPEFEADEVGQWANRLGNQFIMRKSAAGQPPRHDTSTALASEGSPLPVKVPTWSPDAIANRQLRLAERATVVWPRSPR